MRGLSEVAVPVMQRLVQATGETSLISVLDGEEMVYVERIDSPIPFRFGGLWAEEIRSTALRWGSLCWRFSLMRSARPSYNGSS